MSANHCDLEKGSVNEELKSPTTDFSGTSSTQCNDPQQSSIKASWKSFLQKITLRNQAAASNVVVRKLHDCPVGYPSLACFLDSDENFMIYRRFGFLQSRLLLDKQDELRKLEEQLDALDQYFNEQGPENVKTRDLPSEFLQPRAELMTKIEKTFCEYATLISSARKLVGLKKPSNEDYKSVLNYMVGKYPQCEEEEGWIQRKEDLVTLRPGREHAWLDSGIEHLLRWINCSVIEYLFCSKETREKSDGFEEVYYTRTRIERLVVCIIAAMILILLILPVYILYRQVETLGSGKTDALCIGVLLVFTLAFSAVLSLFTRAKRHEILAAAAGYCAVLVVFLGNLPELKLQQKGAG